LQRIDRSANVHIKHGQGTSALELTSSQLADTSPQAGCHSIRSATREIDDNLGNTMSQNRGDSDVVYGMIELAVNKERIYNAWSQEMEQVRRKVLCKTSDQ
jgi:flagellar basal body-associated protein FliL